MKARIVSADTLSWLFSVALLVLLGAYFAWLGGLSPAATLELLGAVAVVLLGLAIFPGSVIFLALYVAYDMGRDDGRREEPRDVSRPGSP